MSTALEELPPLINKNKDKKKIWRKLWRQRSLYVLGLPGVIVTFLFCYMPIWGLTLAFKDYSPALGLGSPWAENVSENFWFFKDPEFWYVFLNTIKISAVKFIFLFPAPIILALMINEVKVGAYKRLVQTITYIPHFVSWVIISGIFYVVFSYESHSPVNALLAVFGLNPVNLMANEKAFLPMLIVSALVKEVGWGTIIYLAAISNIDPQLYEAAIMDGAKKLAQTRYITLPCILPIITILLILRVPTLLSAGLDQIYNMMNPMTLRAANVTDIYIIRVGLLQGQYGYATALGLVFGVLQLTLALTANKIAKGSFGYGLW